MWRIFSKTAGIVAYVCLQAVVNSIRPPGPHHSPKQAQVTGTHSVAAPQDINASPTGLAGSGHNPLPLSLGRKKQHWSSAFKLITPSQLQVSDQWVSVPFFHFIKCLNPSRPPLGLPWCSDSKESTCNAGEPGWIPGSGRSPPPPEESMATHSSILAWEIPWTEESGGLQSMGSQRVRHDWETNTSTTTGHHYVYKLDSSCTRYPLIFFFPVQFLTQRILLNYSSVPALIFEKIGTF